MCVEYNDKDLPLRTIINWPHTYERDEEVWELMGNMNWRNNENETFERKQQV